MCKKRITMFNKVMQYELEWNKNGSIDRNFKITIDNDFAGYLIGRRGCNIKKMREKHNCKIVITRGYDNNEGKRYVKIEDWSDNWEAIGELIYKKYEYEK